MSNPSPSQIHTRYEQLHRHECRNEVVVTFQLTDAAAKNTNGMQLNAKGTTYSPTEENDEWRKLALLSSKLTMELPIVSTVDRSDTTFAIHSSNPRQQPSSADDVQLLESCHSRCFREAPDTPPLSTRLSDPVEAVHALPRPLSSSPRSRPPRLMESLKDIVHPANRSIASSSDSNGAERESPLGDYFCEGNTKLNTRTCTERNNIRQLWH